MGCEQVNYINKHMVGSIYKPISHHNISPWVKVWFTENGDENNPLITVGNESCSFACDPQHTAVVKLFEYGFTDGVQCKLTILDEQGGSMEDISQRLNKCIKNAKQDYSMKVQWGWVGVNCMDSTKKVIKSPTLTFLPMNIEIRYQKGAISYTITAVDLLQAVFVSRSTDILGTDLNGLTLTQALEKLFEDSDPKMKFKKVRMVNGHMLEGNAAYKWEGADEIEQSWNSDGQNKLSTAIKWTEFFKTNHNKGTIPYWDSEASEPTICFLEGMLGCDTTEDELKERSIGTFIVNGGNCSNVIDFTPNINWVAAFAQMATGGQVATPLSQKIEKRENEKPGCGKLGSEDQGMLQSADSNKNTERVRGYAENATKETMEAQNLNESAGSLSAMTHPIEAKLTIQGNPAREFCIFTESVARTCAIVAINPWHIRKGGGSNGNCPDWTVHPPCNPILTNKYWLVKGCNHTIKEGSYTTTIDLFLATPGIDIGPGEPVGKDSSWTSSPSWTPNAC